MAGAFKRGLLGFAQQIDSIAQQAQQDRRNKFLAEEAEKRDRRLTTFRTDESIRAARETAPTLTKEKQDFAGFTPEEINKARRVKAGLEPKATAGGFSSLIEGLSDEEVKQAKRIQLGLTQDAEKAFTEKQKLEEKVLKKKVESNKTRFDQAKTIRAEVAKASTEFEKVKDANARIGSLDVSAAGDLALIFNFMKMLDPGSVVRESEFATAANSAGVPDRIRNTYNKLLSGERLAENQRKDFLKQAANLFEAAENNQAKRLDDFVKLGKRFNLEKGDIIVSPIGEEEQGDAAKAATPIKIGRFNIEIQ